MQRPSSQHARCLVARHATRVPGSAARVQQQARRASTGGPPRISPSPPALLRQRRDENRNVPQQRRRQLTTVEAPPGVDAIANTAGAAAAATNTSTTTVEASPPPWRPASVLDHWVKKEARPISLKQLTFFGRTLTPERLLSSANYVREELPTRLAHRLRDMQTLPYVVVANRHVAHVYERYYSAFETFRRVPPLASLADNDAFCATIAATLEDHLTVIPSMAMGVLECHEYLTPRATDRFMNNMLRARISRRVIAEQHIALTNSLRGAISGSSSSSPSSSSKEHSSDGSFVGEVFLKCNAAEVVQRCAAVISGVAMQAFGRDARVPEVVVRGHLDATFPYIPSHLEYIVGEILRNSFSATFERHGGDKATHTTLPPVEVLIVEAPQHVILRFSDRGGGIPAEILPTLWSFGKGPRTQMRLENLSHVPRMAATMQELDAEKDGGSASTKTNMDGLPADDHVGDGKGEFSPPRPGDSMGGGKSDGSKSSTGKKSGDTSLSGLASRPPGLRLGMGLPMSRVYAEFWAGSLNLQSMAGHGTDVFLHISKLGNKNEQLTTRASMDAL